MGSDVPAYHFAYDGKVDQNYCPDMTFNGPLTMNGFIQRVRHRGIAAAALAHTDLTQATLDDWLARHGDNNQANKYVVMLAVTLLYSNIDCYTVMYSNISMCSCFVWLALQM